MFGKVFWLQLEVLGCPWRKLCRKVYIIIIGRAEEFVVWVCGKVFLL